jgi:hypothetical protein
LCAGKWLKLEIMMLSELGNSGQILHVFSYNWNLGEKCKGHESKRGTTREVEREGEKLEGR